MMLQTLWMAGNKSCAMTGKPLEMKNVACVALDIEDEDETALIPFAWVVEAKLVLNDQLMKLGAEARASRLITDDPQQETSE